MEDRLVGKTILDTYRVVERVGAGGMGTLYKAIHLPLAQVVALKFIHPHVRTPKTIRRFQREARTLGSLKHPNIVGVKAFYAEGDDVFFVMEYLEGEDLASLLKRKGSLSLPEFKEIFSQVVDGVEYLHASGIVHRDLKPANIMLVAQPDGTSEVKILDFGLAKAMDESASQRLTASGTFVGTLQYVSPEQLSGKQVDVRSDVYSLACVMWEALSGEEPFSADGPVAAMTKHLSGTLPPMKLAEFAAISSVLQRCTAADPDGRLGSVRDMWSAIIKNESIPNAIPAKWPRVSKKVWITAACCLGAAIVVGGFVVVQSMINKSNIALQQSVHTKEVQQLCAILRRGMIVSQLQFQREHERTRTLARFSPQELEQLSEACADGSRKTSNPELRAALVDNMIDLAIHARLGYREANDTGAAERALAKALGRLKTPEDFDLADSSIKSRLFNAHMEYRYYDKTALLLTEGEILLAKGNSNSDYVANDRLEEAWGNALKMLERRDNPPPVWNLPPRTNVVELACRSAVAMIRHYMNGQRYDEAVDVGETAKRALAPWVEATPADLAPLNQQYELALQKSRSLKQKN
jgi:serine/threonine protein kinase